MLAVGSQILGKQQHDERLKTELSRGEKDRSIGDGEHSFRPQARAGDRIQCMLREGFKLSAHLVLGYGNDLQRFPLHKVKSSAERFRSTWHKMTVECDTGVMAASKANTRYGIVGMSCKMRLADQKGFH